MIQGVQRTARVVTSLPEGQLVFYGLTGHERLGCVGQYQIDLLSENPNLGLSDVLGQPISITLEQPDYKVRQFNGVVADFWFAGELGRYVAYRATVRPWLWLLSQRVGSRIFQAKTVPEVIELLIREHGFSEIVNGLNGEYRRLEYLVQYRESDLDFLCRLMELEGIYFYFRHHDGIQTLVLADSSAAHDPVPGYESIPFYPPQPGERRERDHLYAWSSRRAVRPALFATRDFNFTRPDLPISAARHLPLSHAYNYYEVFDYPGKFQDTQEAENQIRIRQEELQADFELFHAEGNARGLGCGALFQLTEFPREDQNKEYLIVEAQYEITVGDYESIERGVEQPDVRMRLVAIDSKQPYRSPRVTRKPVVEGPQTATVVGQAGQEIWTDQYGRIRVQFHWDREGQANERSSCWVRVSQAWAGMNFGSIHIPRIGQEVIVDFLEGDPDRPLVTGRVYNSSNMPPYDLPDHQTQSGIKSRSTKGATPENFNEIRFEDKKGQEELTLQAEKNMTTLVKNDQSTTVKANRSASVTGSDSISVGGDRSVSVSGNLSVTVQGGGKGSPHSCLSVTGKHDVSASDTIEMAAPTHIKLTCGGSSILVEPGKITISAGGGASVVLDANLLAKSDAGSSVLLDANACSEASGGAKVLLDGNVLAESSGGTSIVLDGNAAMCSPGDVVLDGMTIAGTGKTEASFTVGGQSAKLTPASVDVAGAMVNVNGNTMVSIAAPMIKIG